MLNRWACCHFRPARTGTGWRTAIQGHTGFPDIVLARAGVVLLRELKGPKGALSPEQRDWARQIDPAWGTPAVAGGAHRVWSAFDLWRPADWDTLIIPTLTARQS
jgi:hypothetical protein